MGRDALLPILIFDLNLLTVEMKTGGMDEMAQGSI